MPETLPKFKYHKNPIQTGSIEKKETVCPVCNQKKQYVYVGPFFTSENVEGICPWCIADGSAAKKFNGEFQDIGSIETPIDKTCLDELIHRTPGYMAWQQEQWLTHCNEPCCFIDYVGSKEISEMKIDVTKDIQLQAEQYGISVDELSERLVSNGSLQGYLFQCTKCGKYRLTTDCD